MINFGQQQQGQGGQGFFPQMFGNQQGGQQPGLGSYTHPSFFGMQGAPQDNLGNFNMNHWNGGPPPWWQGHANPWTSQGAGMPGAPNPAGGGAQGGAPGGAPQMDMNSLIGLLMGGIQGGQGGIPGMPGGFPSGGMASITDMFKGIMNGTMQAPSTQDIFHNLIGGAQNGSITPSSVRAAAPGNLGSFLGGIINRNQNQGQAPVASGSPSAYGQGQANG